MTDTTNPNPKAAALLEWLNSAAAPPTVRALVEAEARRISQPATLALLERAALGRAIGELIDAGDAIRGLQARLNRALLALQDKAPVEAERDRAYRYILTHCEPVRDHACGRCVPGGPMVRPDWTCLMHTVRDWAAAQPPAPEPAA